MKRLLIYDVAAEKTGAKAVLDSFYEKYREATDVEVFVVTSLLEYPETKYLHNIKIPWSKKSRLHRLYCDNVYVQSLIRKFDIHEVLNLQNVALRGIHVPQTVYIHNAIPFSDVDFDFRTERSLWIFKHVIGRLIKKRIRFADRVIVQAPWMKNRIARQCDVDPMKILVMRADSCFKPDTNRKSTGKVEFFYPANASTYKNHDCIISACEELKRRNVETYTVYFTLDAESGRGKRLAEIIKKKELPIKFLGLLNKEQMAEYYRRTILLFPSILETVGLPLLEAQQFGCTIIAADLEYAHDTIGGYENVFWFDPREDGYKTLVDLMEQEIHSE